MKARKHRPLDSSRTPPGPLPEDVDGEGVALVAGGGSAFFRLPRAIRNLDAHQRLVFEELERAMSDLEAAFHRVDHLVETCRDHGLSWATIGHVTGHTPDGARRRFAGDQ
jgi:hypothetical protein